MRQVMRQMGLVSSRSGQVPTNLTIKDALLVVLAVLAIALFIAIGGDDEADLRAHAQWMAQTKDRGAWVMW